MQAAEAADAVFAEAGLAAQNRYTYSRGQSSTHWPQEVQASLALNLAAFLPESLGIMEASKALMGLERGGSVLAPDIVDIVGDYGGQLLGTELGLGGVHGGHHHVVGEEPDVRSTGG